MSELHEHQKPRTAVYASVGKALTHYDIQADTATLIRRASLNLPCKVQYVWPHPALPFLYAACSNGSPEARRISVAVSA